MNTKPVKRVYRIVHSTDPRSRYALLDETDTVVAINDSVFVISALAFDGLADELRHDYLNTRNPDAQNPKTAQPLHPTSEPSTDKD